MESSDPLTSVSNPPFEANQVEENHSTENAHPRRIHPIAIIVITDFLIPIVLLLMIITTMSITGIVLSVVLLSHVLIMNKSKKRTSGLKVMFIVEIVLSIVVLVLTIIILTENDLQSNVLKYAGLDFRVGTNRKPYFALVVASISIILSFMALALCQEARMSKIRHYQSRIFSATWAHPIMTFLWFICLAYIGAATSSVLYIPLLVYFLYTTVTQCLTGKSHVHKVIAKIIYSYSILYSLFILYQISPIGERYNFSKWIGWLVTAPRNVDPLLSIMCVLFCYFSTQLMLHSESEIEFIPKFVHVEILILLGFIAIYLYALFYPNFFAVLWIAIISISSFFKMKVICGIFYRVLTIVFCASFFVIALTSYATFKVTENNIMHSFGLFMYKQNFNFLIFGFYIVTWLSQLGKLVDLPEKPRDDKPIKKRAFRLRKCAFIIRAILRYIIVGAVIVLGICCGMYTDRYAFHAVFAITMIVVLLQLYYRWVFYVIQVLSGMLILVNCFFISSDRTLWFKSILVSGFKAPDDDLFGYTLFPALIFLLSIVINHGTYIMTKFPPWGRTVVFVGVAIGHLVLVFITKTSVFTFIYMYTAVGVIAALLLNSRDGLLLSRLCSSIALSVHLALFELSHFDSIRNLICAVISKRSIIDISEAKHPNFEVVVMGICLFLESIGFNETEKDSPKNILMDDLFAEIQNVSRKFYFYISWILLFGFSVSNNYPTFVKLLLILCFLFGSGSFDFFTKIRLIMLWFTLALLGCQLCLQVFSYEGESASDIMHYIGLYFTDKEVTNRARNVSIGWLLGFVYLAILNIRNTVPSVPSDEFESTLAVRIYNAVCACLHHLLPVIVQVALVVSSLYNPSIFGWLSFLILMLVVFKDSILVRCVTAVTIVFNMTFIIQYLLWLGCPRFLFFFKLDGIINEWGRFLGIVDVTRDALIANCITALIFTFYLQYHLTFVDYKEAFDNLPFVIRRWISFLTKYIFEIIFSITIVIAIGISTFDALFFVIMANILFLCCLTCNYSYAKAINVMSWYTFCVIGARLLSRMPIFTKEGAGNIIYESFSLPFSDGCDVGKLWTVIFALERFCVHIMKSDIYNESQEELIKHRAYKFIRNRQLELIEQMDQEILLQKHHLDLEQMNNLTDDNIETIYTNMRDYEELKMKPHENKENIVDLIIDKFILFMAKTYSINSEAGVNVLTLETVRVLMLEMIRSQEARKRVNLEPRELDFLKSLPPSFFIQFHSLEDFAGFKCFAFDDKRSDLFWRYVLLGVRRISLPLLTLVCCIYAFLKPYIWSMIIFIYVIVVFCSLDIRSHPAYLRIFLGIIMMMLIFRTCANCTMVNDLLTSASNTLPSQRMKIPLLDLIGLSPGSSVIEILVYLCGCFVVIDRLSDANAFPPSEYYNTFTKILPKFPSDYCYGIVNRPDETFALSARPAKFVESLAASMNKTGLMETKHSCWMMLIDMISFIVLLICWNRWVQSNDSTGDVTQMFVLSFNVGFIFILIIHAVFTFVMYFFSISYQFTKLFFCNSIWLFYSMMISFFLIPSISRQFPGSLQFYLVLRYTSHLIAAHLCRVGRRYIAFRYPDFAKEGKYIFAITKFVRICPFAFEIQTLFLWMAQKTYVSIMDFFVFCDIKQQVECLMIGHASSDQTNPYVKQKTSCTAGIILVLFMLLLFGPLFFMVEGTGNTVANPPLSATLEAGVTSFPPFWTGYAAVNPMTVTEHKQLAAADKSYLKPLIIASRESMSILEFESSMGTTWAPEEHDITNIIKLLGNSSSQVIPYYRVEVIFTHPTSSSNSRSVIYQVNGDDLDPQIRQQLLELLQNNSDLILDIGIRLPLAFFVPTNLGMSELNQSKQTITLDFHKSTAVFWNFRLQSTTNDIGFLESFTSYKCILWSQPVDSDSLVGKFVKSAGGISGIYILIVITLGEVIREITLSFISNLWISRMKKPSRMYRMILAATAFRIGKQPEKEKDMIDKLLDTLRSQEQVLQLTN